MTCPCPDWVKEISYEVKSAGSANVAALAGLGLFAILLLVFTRGDSK